MAGDPNVYDALDRAIADQRSALPSSGAVDDSTTWPEEERTRLADLQEDYSTVQVHRWKLDQSVAADAPSACRACHEDRPCSTIRELAKRYGVHGEGEHTSGRDRPLSRAALDGDKVGQCACGLHGQQSHLRLSRPGEEPEVYVRHKFECLPTRPGPHFRID